MSDFLSNFTKGNYDGKKVPPTDPEESKDVKGTSSESIPSERRQEEKHVMADPVIQEDSHKQEQVTRSRSSKRSDQNEVPSRFESEETEYDPTYKKRKQMKVIYLALGALVSALLLFFLYYQLTHVKVPDFVNQSIAEARTWANDQGVALKVDQAYNFDVEVNQVVSQQVTPGKKMKKGKSLTVVSSLGADPEEEIQLPDFSGLSKEAAVDWVSEHKADNVSLIEAFDDKIKVGEFIKQEAANKGLDLSAYRRRDRLSVYYSKGKEVFEKTIEVPDFKGKPIAEVTEWAKKNEVKLKKVEDFSATVAVDSVISQETAKGEKIAKQDEFVVRVSTGKAIIFPDYSKYTIEEATALETKIPVVIKQIFSSSVSYGEFLHQSEESGKEYKEGDTIPPVEVLYSKGRPYMKDLRGSMQEGDLPKLFFDEFQSKGAFIYYDTYYVNSAMPKGTVVEMSHYGQFMPMEATISIGISLGNLNGDQPTPDVNPGTPDDNHGASDPNEPTQKNGEKE